MSCPDFWRRVDFGPACWAWTGPVDRYGYGKLGIRQSTVKAHRMAYRIVNGPIPDGMDLDHLCRNRRCVNPLHLEPVTRRRNTLRGTSITAENAAKTACHKGHPFDAKNTYVRNGKRSCRACNLEAVRKRQRRLEAGGAS